MYQYTLEDIQNRTGLRRDFINKCNAGLSDLLSRFRTKGDKNKILYDDDGLRMWDVIKQHKEKGANIPQIREHLEKVVPPTLQTSEQSDEVSTEALQFDPQTLQSMVGKSAPNDTQVLVNAMLQMHQQHLGDRDKGHQEIQGALKGQIQALEKQMLLLTDGRTPEEVRQELREATEDRVELGRLRQTNQRAQELVAELEGLTGKWWKGKRLREIVNQLSRLEAEG